jgi:hypothetical protein
VAVVGGLLGFGAGLIVATLNRSVWDRLSPSARLSGEGPSIFEPQGTTCPTCRRPLPAGVAKCPFCNPVIPVETPLAATVHAEHKPLEELVPMAGLAVAAKQMKEAGARGYLHIFVGANKGQSLLLTKDVVTIGRAPENRLILQDEGVSHKHAEVRAQGNDYYAKDLGSKNGTFVNDQRVDERRLVSGDVIALGEYKMLFQVS